MGDRATGPAEARSRFGYDLTLEERMAEKCEIITVCGERKVQGRTGVGIHHHKGGIEAAGNRLRKAFPSGALLESCRGASLRGAEAWFAIPRWQAGVTYNEAWRWRWEF